MVRNPRRSLRRALLAAFRQHGQKETTVDRIWARTRITKLTRHKEDGDRLPSHGLAHNLSVRIKGVTHTFINPDGGGRKGTVR